MKMKFTTLSACLLASFMTYAVPVAPIVKGATMVWDEVAKVALKISGKEITKNSVKDTAGKLSKIAGTQGDNAARLAAKGGVVAIEKSVTLGPKFTRLLMKSATISDDAIKSAARYSDDVLKYSAKYGDDVIVINAKAPGLSGRQIMAAGVSASMVIGATGGAIAGNKMANGAVASSLATAKNVSQNNEWAERVIEDPNSPPEAKEEAKRILWQNHQRADAGKWTFRIIAGGVAGLTLLLGFGVFKWISGKSK